LAGGEDDGGDDEDGMGVGKRTTPPSSSHPISELGPNIMAAAIASFSTVL
jgi:hypothetical protein